jgi:hypothetical protein
MDVALGHLCGEASIARTGTAERGRPWERYDVREQHMRHSRIQRLSVRLYQPVRCQGTNPATASGSLAHRTMAHVAEGLADRGTQADMNI